MTDYFKFFKYESIIQECFTFLRVFFFEKIEGC